MPQKKTGDQLITIAQGELKLSMGCTDPVAIAFSCNNAIELYTSKLDVKKEKALAELKNIEISLDKNLFKNATSARIPGSGGKGIHLAVALGLVLPTPSEPLLIFKGITKTDIDRANSLLDSVSVLLTVKEGKDHIYASTSLTFSDNIHTIAVVEGQHDAINSLQFQGEEIFKKSFIEEEAHSSLILKLEDVLGCIETIPLSDIEFINEGFSYNVSAGKTTDNILQSEASIIESLYGTNLNSKASLIYKTRTSISNATRRRMGGEEIPILSCGGSGNHGITFFISLFYGFKMIEPKKEILHTALLGLYLLHMVKQVTGVLTPMCGCALSSSLAVAASLTWASGGSQEQVIRAMNFVVNTLAGIACDGAKPSCALKTSLAGQVALESTLFALTEAPLALDEGLSGENFPLLLSIIKKIHIEGMDQFDSTMIDIIQERITP